MASSTHVSLASPVDLKLFVGSCSTLAQKKVSGLRRGEILQITIARHSHTNLGAGQEVLESSLHEQHTSWTSGSIRDAARAQN